MTDKSADVRFFWHRTVATRVGAVTLDATFQTGKSVTLSYNKDKNVYESEEMAVACGTYKGHITIENRKYQLEPIDIKSYTFEVDLEIIEDDEPTETSEVSNNNKGEVPSTIHDIQAIENDLKNIPPKMDASIKLSNRYEDLVRQQMANGGRTEHGSRSNSRSGSEFSQSDSRYRQNERSMEAVTDVFDYNSEKQRSYYNNVDNVHNWQARNGSMANEQELNQFFSSDNISHPGSDRGSERGSQKGLERTSERGSIRGSERDIERDSLRGSERGSVRDSIRGSERGSMRESLRGSERGSERESLRGLDRDFERDSLRGSERESLKSSDRDFENDSLRGSERESFRGSNRDVERDSLRGSERGSERESFRGSERGSERDSLRGSARGSEKGFQRGDSRRSSRRSTPTNSNRQSPVGSDLGRTLVAEDDQAYPGGQAFQPLMKTPLVTNRSTTLKSGSTSSTPAMTNGIHENGLKEEVYKLQEREDKLSKLLEEKETGLINAHHEITDLKAHTAKLQDEIEELQNKNSPAYQYTAKLENDKKIDELLREKENLLTEIHKLKQELANEKRLDSVSQVGATGVGAVLGRGDGPSPIEAYHPNNPSALQRQIDDLTDQLKDLQEAHETAVTSLASAEKRLQDTGNDVSLGRDLQEAHIENKKLREQIENLEKSQMGDVRLHDEIQHLRDELRSMREQTYQLNEDNIRLREILYDNKRTTERSKTDTLPKVNTNKNFNSTRDTSYSRKEERFDRSEMYNGTADNFREKKMDVSDNRLLRHSPGTRNSMSSKRSGQHRSPSPARSDTSDTTIMLATLPPSQYRPKQLISSTSHVQNGLHSDKGNRYDDDLDPMMNDLDDLHLVENRRERSRRLSTGTGSTNSILDEVEDELELSGGRRHIEEYNASTAYGRRSGSPPRSPRDPRLLNSGFRSVSPPPLVTQHNKDLLGPQMEGKFDIKGRRPFAPRSPADCNIGDIIKFTRNGGRVSRGAVKYIGHLHGKNDAYLGVELEHGDSKHDGTYEGQRYFKCKPNKGVFVAFNKVIMVWGD
ncbi:unnamed protein product [Owenia fusiformis]|uniref:Uncharacterized protein n=1 Tax=Owenia fusiformis TaxID=6347 RepID=A0A8J1TBD1_OWEFU|nr:unnamed protein product [Owenia fusiformis]